MFSLIVPTKGRPDGVARLLKSIDIPCAVMLCATCNEDLPNNLYVLNEFLSIDIRISSDSVVKSFNDAAMYAHNTIAVICDDMEFLPGALSKALSDVKSDYVTGFMTANISDAVPIPFVGLEYYKQVGRLADPEYKHFFWDEEIVELADSVGRYKFVSEYPLLNHYHPSVGGTADKTFREGRTEKWQHDKQVYDSRLLHGQVR
jgi:hypothetical protein